MKHNNEGFKYFIDYQEGGIVKPLCIILPQWVDTTNTLKTVVKHVFFIKDDEVWEKYEKNSDVIKNKLGIKFHNEPIYKKNT